MSAVTPCRDDHERDRMSHKHPRRAHPHHTAPWVDPAVDQPVALALHQPPHDPHARSSLAPQLSSMPMAWTSSESTVTVECVKELQKYRRRNLNQRSSRTSFESRAAEHSEHPARAPKTHTRNIHALAHARRRKIITRVTHMVIGRAERRHAIGSVARGSHTQ